MSWAAEAWKQGLPTKALQKIEELESQLDKLKKERQQKQFQLESLEAAFQKQKQKVENEKSEVTALKRENQSLMEICDNLEKNKQKISHDHQTKESQVNYLEGQLSSSKKLIEKLELELKRYNSDLEKSQQTSGDLSSCCTPQKSFVVTISPAQALNDSKFEQLQEKYNKEVEERKRLEAEMKTLQVKKMDTQLPQSVKSHRDIARHQASSSVFLWQSELTPRQPLAGSQATPSRRGIAASHFPWELEKTPSKQGLKDDSFHENSINSQLCDQLRTQNQELKSRVNELELCLQVQEKDLKNHLKKMQELQHLLEKAQVELTEKEKALTKSREEVVRTSAQFEQIASKNATLEQKLKKVSEELSCQRQNAESARHSVEQKLKEKEKEYQADMLLQQHLLQNLNQQFNQMKGKLSQELQQAKNDYNMLYSERDKISASKIILEKEVDELKRRLSGTEQALQASQTRENDLKKNTEEIKTERNSLNCQHDQKLREMNRLEEELKKTIHILKENQKFSEEVKNKNIALETDLKVAQEKLQKDENARLLQNLKLIVANLEKQRDSAEDLLKKRECDIEEISNKLSMTEKESESLKNIIGLKEKECEEIKKEIVSFSQWQQESEYLANQQRFEKEEILRKVNTLEGCLRTNEEKIKLQKNEKDTLCLQIENLKNLVDSQTLELETQKQTYDKLQQKAECTNKSYKQEDENMLLKITQLTKQVEELEPSIFKDKICFLELSLQQQKQVNFLLQNQCEELQKDKTEMEQRLTEKEKMHESFVTNTNRHVKTLQEDASSHLNCIETAKLTLEEKEQQLQTLSKELDNQQAAMQAVINKNKILENKVEELHHLLEMWRSEKENMSLVFSVNKQEGEQFNTLHCEKNNLLEVDLQFSNCIKENDKNDSELLEKHRDERKAILDRCGVSERELASLQEQYRALEEKKDKLEMLLNEQTNHLLESKVELEHSEREHHIMIEEYKSKLDISEKNNKALKESSENLQKNMENSHLQNAKELDYLKQELANFEEEQKKKQSEHDQLLQVVEHLTKDILAKNEKLKACELALENIHNTEESLKENELKKVQVKIELLQMDLEDKQSSIDYYTERVSKQEDALRQLKTELEESEREKNVALQELYAVKKALMETQSFKTEEVSSIEQFIKFSDHDDIHANYKKEMDKECNSYFHKLTLAQNKSVLSSSIHVSIKTLEKLEKICDVLQLKMLQLASVSKESKSECTVIPDKITEEAEIFVKEIKLLKDEIHSLHTDLINLREENNRRVSFETASCCEGDNLGNDLNVPSKEKKIHLAEVEEKFSSLQTEHKILLEQCNTMKSEILELQYSTETLRTEKLTLLSMLKEIHPDSIETQVSSCPRGDKLKTGKTDTCSALREGDGSFFIEAYKMESTFGKKVSELTECNRAVQDFEETDLTIKMHSNLGDDDVNTSTTDSSINHEFFLPRVADTKTKIEELEALCYTYEQSIKELQEQCETHENTKNDEIQTLQQMIVSNQTELDCLKKKYSSENEQWQQKLKELTAEMEAKLAIEKQQTEYLSQELETARLELQCLDLSSRSLLCADNRDHKQTPFKLENHSQQEVHTLPTEKSSYKTDSAPASECILNMMHNKDSSHEGIDKIARESSTLVNLGKINEAKETINSVSKHTCSVPPVDFEKNQLTIENIQMVLPQIPSENAQLLKCVEESKKKIGTLLLEVNQLSLNLDATQIELNAKTSTNRELERHVLELETENLNLVKEIKSISSDKQQLTCKLKDVEKNLESMTTEVEIYKVKLSSVTEMFSSLEVAKEEWTEKYLEAENELKRIKSEKANIENHALSIETDIEALQTKSQLLENENENKQKLIYNLQEQLSIITVEKNQLNQELNSLSEDQEALHQIYEKLKEKAEDLQSSKADSMEFIKTLEEEIKIQKSMLQTAKSDTDQFFKEKGKLQQHLQDLEKDLELQCLQNDELKNQVRQLIQEKELLAKESETLQTKLNGYETENLKLSKALESSLFEKGEISARLNSAQEEMAQLRNGIEKLKIRIESDEKKKHHIIEKLKESDRKRDSLLDKIENLERDLQMSEENLEDMILQAETTKEEAEKLKDLIEELMKKLETLKLEQESLKSKKEELDEDLKLNQEKISTLETSISTITKLLEKSEHEKIQMEKESKNVVLLLQTQIKDLNEKIVFYCSKQETWEVKEQGLISQVACLECDKTQLLQQIQEAQIKFANLESLKEQLSEELEECKQKVDEKMQENDTLQHQVKAENESWKQEKERLQNEKDKLQKEVQEISTKNGSFQITVDSLDILQKKLERELEFARSERTSLVEKVNDLKTTVLQLTKENETGLSNLELWIQSCKQLEQEKEILQKRTVEQAELLTDLQKKHNKDVGLNTSIDTLKSELEELKEFVEEKTKEADESMEKYCNLIISYHKLEEANDVLKRQVDLLTTQLRQPLMTPLPESPLSSALRTSKKVVRPSDKKPTKERRLSREPSKLSLKRQRPQEGKADNSKQKATTPQSLAKRVKARVTSGEDMEYELEGLPDVVKKGFSDIPTDKHSPCILRRTTLRTSPRLAAQRMSPSTQQCLQNGSLENIADSSEPSHGGSKSHKLSDTKPLQIGSSSGSMESAGSPLSTSNKIKKPASECPRNELVKQKSGRSKSVNKSLEQAEEEETCTVQ
ncbi:centromere protein F [Microcaecilia unicolor]|uniref:Centromere protein F n=1 Tax=Microcaecilia unicolor TaxID=1415580 RepID=A0A6P7XFC7_9AMPH|nr:centromere protein F [Microcaecilia unicolor]